MLDDVRGPNLLAIFFCLIVSLLLYYCCLSKGFLISLIALVYKDLLVVGVVISFCSIILGYYGWLLILPCCVVSSLLISCPNVRWLVLLMLFQKLMQGFDVDLDFSLDWSFGLCVGGLLSSGAGFVYGVFCLDHWFIFQVVFLFSKAFGASFIAIVNPDAVDSFGSGFIQKICLGYTLVDDSSFLVSVPSTCCLHCFVVGSCGYYC